MTALTLEEWERDKSASRALRALDTATASFCTGLTERHTRTFHKQVLISIDPPVWVTRHYTIEDTDNPTELRARLAAAEQRNEGK